MFFNACTLCLYTIQYVSLRTCFLEQDRTFAKHPEIQKSSRRIFQPQGICIYIYTHIHNYIHIKPIENISTKATQNTPPPCRKHCPFWTRHGVGDCSISADNLWNSWRWHGVHMGASFFGNRNCWFSCWFSINPTQKGFHRKGQTQMVLVVRCDCIVDVHAGDKGFQPAIGLMSENGNADASESKHRWCLEL